MALTVGINTYISLADANTYFLSRLNNSVWTAATDETKEAALMQATKILDTYNYLGQKTTSDQTLKFPRSGIYYDGYLLSDTDVHINVIDAECELAIWLMQTDYTAPDELAQYERVQIGPIEVETRESVKKALPPLVQDLLKPFRSTSLRLVRS